MMGEIERKDRGGVGLVDGGVGRMGEWGDGMVGVMGGDGVE